MRTPVKVYVSRPPRPPPTPPAPPTDLHHEARHLIALVRFLGGWPIEQTERGYAAARWGSCAMLWCYVQAIIQATMITACLRSTVPSFAEEDDFLERVILVIHLLYETAPLSVPIVYWGASRGLARYFNHWARLQSTWLEVTGDPLRLECGRGFAASPYCASVVLAFSAGSPFYHTRISPHLYAWKTPVYTFVILQCLVLALLWNKLNGEVVATAVKLRARLHDSVDTLTACGVRGYCLLWLRLRSLAQDLGAAAGAVVLHLLLLSSLLSMTSCFGLLTAVKQGNLRRVGSTLTTIAATTFIITAICNKGHEAVRSVSREILHELLTIPMRHLDADTCLEIMRFLQVLEFKPVNLKLKGFVMVRKKLSVSIATAITTYIVVLAQLALTFSAEQ